MKPRTYLVALAAVFVAVPVCAQQSGTAAGKGSIERLQPSGTAEHVAFSPRYAYAYGEGSGAKRSTWIVLTEKEPPLEDWLAARDAAEARRQWCEKEKTSFVALKLDPQFKVDLYFLCPANGGVNMEMLSTWNGLDSVVATFEVRDPKRLKGRILTGNGSCPAPNGGQAYCTATGDYTFDAPIVR